MSGAPKYKPPWEWDVEDAPVAEAIIQRRRGQKPKTVPPAVKLLERRSHGPKPKLDTPAVAPQEKPLRKGVNLEIEKQIRDAVEIAKRVREAAEKERAREGKPAPQQRNDTNEAPLKGFKRDYVAIATAYADEAIADTERNKFCKWIRLAAERFKNDLKRAEDPDNSFYFDDWHACDPCDFAEKMPHVEGNWVKEGKPCPNIWLEPAQIFFLVNLFGFRNRANDARRFNTALFAVSRKNAKSVLASIILLYCQCCEKENGPQVITAATTGSQARIVFNVAKKMVEKLPALREAFGLEPFANAIVSHSNSGTFKPINSKASTQDGLNPSATCIDEIHAHTTSDLLDVLKSAVGARKNPLYLYTTTEGYENPGPWSEIRHFSKQVLQGLFPADHFLALYYTLDDEDDELDESKWIKANPLLDVSVSLKSIREQALEARGMPGRMAEFRIKKLNKQSAAAGTWINLEAFKQNDTKLDLDWLCKFPCVGALDLASVNDLTAWRLLWVIEGIHYTWGRFWVPRKAVYQRTQRGSVPYAAWVNAGHIKQTDTEVCDYEVVEADILADCARFKPKFLAYDEWNATQTANRLSAANPNLNLIKYIQGPKSFHPAMKEFEAAYSSGKLRYGADPVLLWNAANLVCRTDQNLNMAPDKKKSGDKIDGIVALLMCEGLHALPPGEPDKTYNMFFV